MYFFLGKPENHSIQDEILKENLYYGDIIQAGTKQFISNSQIKNALKVIMIRYNYFRFHRYLLQFNV